MKKLLILLLFVSVVFSAIPPAIHVDSMISPSDCLEIMEGALTEDDYFFNKCGSFAVKGTDAVLSGNFSASEVLYSGCDNTSPYSCVLIAENGDEYWVSFSEFDRNADSGSDFILVIVFILIVIGLILLYKRKR